MLALKDSKGGANEYKPSTLPPQIISLGIKGKYLSATDSIEVNVVFNNIAQNALIYLQDYILTYKKNSIPENPFDGKQELIPKVTSTTVSHTFNLSADYLGNVGFRVFPKNPDKMYQTANIPDVNSLMVTFKKFTKPTFTGSHAYFSDAEYEWMECYGDGTLTIPTEERYDITLVGSGGGTKATSGCTGGAGGGYVVIDIGVSLFGNYTIKIGANSSASGILGDNYTKTASAGNSVNNNENGSSGGSGGGGQGARYKNKYYYPGQGGSNGSNGETCESLSHGGSGGKGQGTTTKEFGTGKLLAGGGGGDGANIRGGYAGPGGGGEGGFNNNDGTPGTPNTGGGAGGAGNRGAKVTIPGGSGLFAIRWRKV